MNPALVLHRGADGQLWLMCNQDGAATTIMNEAPALETPESKAFTLSRFYSMIRHMDEHAKEPG